MKTCVGNERISSHEGDVISTSIMFFFCFVLRDKNEIGLAAGKKQGLPEWIVHTCTAQYSCKRESLRVNNSDVDKASDVLYIQIKKSICRSVVEWWTSSGCWGAWLQPSRLAKHVAFLILAGAFLVIVSLRSIHCPIAGSPPHVGLSDVSEVTSHTNLSSGTQIRAIPD